MHIRKLKFISIFLLLQDVSLKNNPPDKEDTDKDTNMEQPPTSPRYRKVKIIILII